MAEKTQSPEKKALEGTADHCGGQTALADALSKELGKTVSQQWVWSVINRPHPIPPEWCLPLERISEGLYSRHDYRPDLYPREHANTEQPRATA